MKGTESTSRARCAHLHCKSRSFTFTHRYKLQMPDPKATYDPDLATSYDAGFGMVVVFFLVHSFCCFWFQCFWCFCVPRFFCWPHRISRSISPGSPTRYRGTGINRNFLARVLNSRRGTRELENPYDGNTHNTGTQHGRKHNGSTTTRRCSTTWRRRRCYQR